MARRVHHDEFAVVQMLVHVLTYASRRDYIVTALQDQRRRLDLGQVGAIVGHERRSVEMLGDFRIGTAEAVYKFGAEFRAIGVAHDQWRHRLRPAHVIAVQNSSSSSICAAVKPPT